jgi:hypothetical protein
MFLNEDWIRNVLQNLESMPRTICITRNILLLEISFKDDYAVVVGQKQAEDFMNDYNGEIVAVRSK